MSNIWNIYTKLEKIAIKPFSILYNGKNIISGNYVIIKEINKEKFRFHTKLNFNKNEIMNKTNNEIIIDTFDSNDNFYIIMKKDKKEVNKIKINNLQNITSINIHKNCISSISIFPSGNIISVSFDKSIIIYHTINLNVIQNIPNAHDRYIIYIGVKDENNFIIISYDRCVKLWVKMENQYINNKIIKNMHDDWITKIIFCSNGNLISCSGDKKIKIWKENNNNYENIKLLTHSEKINSLLLLEDKNILISSGYDGTKLWSLNINDINSINLIQYFQETSCGWHSQLCRFNDDIIIVRGKGMENGKLKLISISKKEIIKEIDNLCTCFSIIVIEDKGLFLVGGKKDIKIYRNDNQECIQKIKNTHNNCINQFITLKNGSIASCSFDNSLKVWSF